ncbi:MAG: DUF1499 domain-containing protein, partial [Mesorhizobium sp.]|uniref:DUF1499 domain-containing protein n=1 Tax=Mesorhizobium sp. TaxID=1871066 RepID=UPI000FE7CF76
DFVDAPPFLWVLALVALLAALALLLAGIALSRLWNFGDRGGRDLSVGALLAVLVLAPFGVAAYWATIYPPLRDILTAPYPDINGQSEATITAVARGLVLGLPADVAIRVADDGDSVVVDMRSASRYGRHDLGDNADRITDFLAELDQEVAGQVGAAPAE